MSNELVTFGRVPKSTMDTSPTVPGKLWVTNDPQNDNNPDNLAEAYVDDLPNRRMKITDRDLVNRVGELESAKAITDPEIEEIIRNVGSDPASPLNFMNNIAFCEAEASYITDNPDYANILSFELHMSQPTNILDTYNLIVISYIDTSSMVVPTSSPDNVEGLSVKFDGGNAQLYTENFGAKCKGFVYNSPAFPIKIPSGTYLFQIQISNDSFTLNSIYCFQKQQIILESYQIGDPNSNLVSYNTYSSTVNIASSWHSISSDEATIQYSTNHDGMYLLIDTNTSSTTLNIDDILYSEYESIFSGYDIGDNSHKITLPNIYGQYYVGNDTYSSTNASYYLEINKYIHFDTLQIRFLLRLPGNANSNMKRVLFYLPKFLPAFPAS